MLQPKKLLAQEKETQQQKKVLKVKKVLKAKSVRVISYFFNNSVNFDGFYTHFPALNPIFHKLIIPNSYRINKIL